MGVIEFVLFSMLVSKVASGRDWNNVMASLVGVLIVSEQNTDLLILYNIVVICFVLFVGHLCNTCIFLPV